MTDEFVRKWIVFKATDKGPSPTIIEDSRDLAISYIQEAMARGDQAVYSYAPCPERVKKKADRVIAGYIPGYHVSKVNYQT